MILESKVNLPPTYWLHFISDRKSLRLLITDTSDFVKNMQDDDWKTFITSKVKKFIFKVSNACFTLERCVNTIFIRPTCRDVLWYGAGVCPSVCLSVCLSTKLVNTIQTEPFQLGPSNLVHLLLMTRGRTLLSFKVRSQRSRSHITHCCKTL